MSELRDCIWITWDSDIFRYLCRIQNRKISTVVWWVWKAFLYLFISAALGAAYFFTVGLLICGVGYLIAYGIHLLLGLEPPGESSFSFGIFLFIAWISTPYFGFTRGWRVMNRSTGWKFMAKWENNQSKDQPKWSSSEYLTWSAPK